MKKAVLLSAVALALCSTFTTSAFARDTEYQITLADVLNMPEAQGKLDGSVKFYLSGQDTPKIEQSLGEDVSNKKTNGAGKEDIAGCKWAALSALMAFQAKAKQMGANAVVDLHSFYKKESKKSPTTMDCHAGAFVIGVTLKGSYAKVAAR